MFVLSLLYGIGYGIINILLTGRVSNTLMWFLPLSGVAALLAWFYARNGSTLSKMFDTTDEENSIADRVLRWAPLVLVGYILMIFFFLPTKVESATWTGFVTEWHYETVYLMRYDITAPDGSITRHYLQAGEHYLANKTPFTMVSYEVLYGKDDGRELKYKRFEPYSIDIGKKGSEEAPKYNVPDNERGNRGHYRGVAIQDIVKRETYVENYLWFENGKKRITVQGLFPYSVLTISRSSYAPDMIVKGISSDIVLTNSFEDMMQRSKDVTDTYNKALGIRAAP